MTFEAENEGHFVESLPLNVTGQLRKSMLDDAAGFVSHSMGFVICPHPTLASHHQSIFEQYSLKRGGRSSSGHIFPLPTPALYAVRMLFVHHHSICGTMESI